MVRYNNNYNLRGGSGGIANQEPQQNINRQTMIVDSVITDVFDAKKKLENGFNDEENKTGLETKKNDLVEQTGILRTLLEDKSSNSTQEEIDKAGEVVDKSNVAVAAAVSALAASDNGRNGGARRRSSGRRRRRSKRKSSGRKRRGSKRRSSGRKRRRSNRR